MCRAMLYIGPEVIPYPYLYTEGNALIKQTYSPRFMPLENGLNLAGFGMAAWSSQSDDKFLVYRTSDLPLFDHNLMQISSSIRSHCFVAHIRGVRYSVNSVISAQNAHPFIDAKTGIAFAHNGYIAGFESIVKPHLISLIDPKFYTPIRGTTDTEFIFALFLTKLMHVGYSGKIENIAEAVLQTINTLREVIYKCRVVNNAPLNFFVTNGHSILATRYAAYFGRHAIKEMLIKEGYPSLWYTFTDNNFLVASEPLELDTTSWIELPEYTLIYATKKKSTIDFHFLDIP